MQPKPAADKRQHIIETAYGLFRDAGYHATGIDRIIAQADVAKMTMYRHFPSKDGLIVEVLNHRAKRFDAQLDRLAQAAMTPAAKITTIIDWYGRWFHRADFHGCLFSHALAEFGEADHPVFKAITAQKDGFRQRLRLILADALPEDRADAAATTLFMLFEGATLLAQMGHAEAALANLRQASATVLTASGVEP